MTVGRGRERLLVLAAAALFGTTGTAQAFAPPGARPSSVGAARIVVGGAVLALAAVRRRRVEAPAAPDRGGTVRRSVAAASLAVAGVASYQLCFFAAVDRAGVALGTAVAIGLAPPVTGLLALLWRRERPEPGWPAASVLAVVGCLLLLSPGAGDPAARPAGLVLALGAGAAYAVYTLAGKSLLEMGWPPRATTGVAFGGGALLLLPVLLAGNPGWLLSARGALVAGWLGLAATAAAYLLFARGLAGLPPASVATLTLAEPLVAALLGVAVLGERPGPVGASGAVLVLAGLAVLTRRPSAGGRC